MFRNCTLVQFTVFNHGNRGWNFSFTINHKHSSTSVWSLILNSGMANSSCTHQCNFSKSVCGQIRSGFYVHVITNASWNSTFVFFQELLSACTMWFKAARELRRLWLMLREYKMAERNFCVFLSPHALLGEQWFFMLRVPMPQLTFQTVVCRRTAAGCILPYSHYRARRARFVAN